MEFSAVKPEKLKRLSTRFVSERQRVRVAPPAQGSARDNGMSTRPHSVARRADNSGSFSPSFSAGANEAQGVAQRRSAKQDERLGLLPVTVGPFGMVPSRRSQFPLMLRCSASGLASRQQTGVGYIHSIGQNNA